MNQKDFRRTMNIVIGISIAILATLAIVEQMRRPPEERTWEGRVLGFPYDFRIPTLERIRDAYWNEHSSQIFTPKSFGIGWDINFYPLVHPEMLQKP